MDKINQNKKKCPRCGYEDIGKYCSRCSYELDLEIENVFHEMYHSFILKFINKFCKFPFWWKFIKTWWYSFFRPGKINLSETYTDSAKYLNDIKFVSTLFYITVGSALIKAILTFENIDEGYVFDSIFGFLRNLFIHTYILWIFSFMLLAFIWTGRIWRKWMKMQIKEQRQYDSIFIYEFGTILTIVISLFWIFGNKIGVEIIRIFDEISRISSNKSGDEIIHSLPTTFWVLLILFLLHFLYLFITIGIRKRLPIKRLIIISLVCIILYWIVALAVEIITLPIILLLPILVILSPIFFIVRNIYKKFKRPKTI